MKRYSYCSLLCVALCLLASTKSYSLNFDSQIKSNILALDSSVNQTEQIKLAATRWITDDDDLEYARRLKDYGCAAGQEPDGHGGCQDKCSASDFPYTNSEDSALSHCNVNSCEDAHGKHYACSACKEGYEKNHLTGLCEEVDGTGYPLDEKEINPDAGDYDCIPVGDKKKCRYEKCNADKGYFYNEKNYKCEPNDCSGFKKGQISDVKCTKPAVCLSAGVIYSRCEECEAGYESTGLTCAKKTENEENTCKRGYVYYDDDTCSEYLVKGKKAIGMVTDSHQKLVIALDEKKLKWANDQTRLNIPNLKDFNYPDNLKDYAGEENTNIIIEVAKESKISHEAAEYCANYKVGGKSWYLPALGQLISWQSPVVKDKLVAFGGKATCDDYYWSSTEEMYSLCTSSLGSYECKDYPNKANAWMTKLCDDKYALGEPKYNERMTKCMFTYTSAEVIDSTEEDNCSDEAIINEYPLTSCPEGAICAYTACGSGRYKIDHCQNDYQLIDGTCKCHKELSVVGILAKYNCNMCHSEWGGDMCQLELETYHESAGRNYEFCEVEKSLADESSEMGFHHSYDSGLNINDCTWGNNGASNERIINQIQHYWLSFDAADDLGINTDALAQTKTLITHEGGTHKEIRLHHGYRNGVDTQYDLYDHQLYFTEKDCQSIGKKYFGTGHEGEIINLSNGSSDKGCKADCTGFDLDTCPEKGICLACGNKFKLIGEEHDNIGWICKKWNVEKGQYEPSKECKCNTYKKAVGGIHEIEGCSAAKYLCHRPDDQWDIVYPTEATDCAVCNQGYKMGSNGICEFVPCGPEYWMGTQMNTYCSEDAWKYGITCDNNRTRPTIEYVPMSGCKVKDVCEKHHGNNAYIGNQQWADEPIWGYFSGDKRDGCAFEPNFQYHLTCKECESGYTMMNNACVADSGVGSIYKYNGKPVGIVFEETSNETKIVSLETLGGVKYSYSSGSSGSDGTTYYWEDAVAAAKNYAPSECGSGSVCGKGKWHLPTLEEMEKVSKNFDDGGPLLQAIRGLEASCSFEHSMRLESNRYWTSTETTQDTNAGSVYGEQKNIPAAYCVYHPISSLGQSSCVTGKKNAPTAYEHYVRPVLTISKNNSSTTNTNNNSSTKTCKSYELKNNNGVCESIDVICVHNCNYNATAWLKNGNVLTCVNATYYTDTTVAVNDWGVTRIKCSKSK